VRLLLAVVLALAAIPLSPVSVGAAVPGTGCSVFPADNVWNTDISSLPVHPQSAAWLASTGATSGRLLHPDFGGPPYGIPFNVVDNAHATASFNFLYWQESDPTVATQQPQGPYPYGSDLAIEAPTDSHLLTINKDTCTLYEIAGTNYNGPQTAWSGAVFNLSSNALRPDTWTSADAAGLPIFPGLVRLDEVQAGAINHAIRFTVQQSDTSHLWPARHDAGTASNPNLPPMGARFRLKASYDTSGFSAQSQVVLTAMKHYGLIVADNGSNWYFTGTQDAGWNNEPYATMVAQLKTVPASAFEAIDESSLMVSPDSAQAAVHPRCASVGVAPASRSFGAGTQVTVTGSATGCPNPLYEFWQLNPGSATWQAVQPFSARSSFTWSTAGQPLGSYRFSVWVRDAASPGAYGNGLGAYDAFNASTYYSLVPGCGSVAVSTTPASPAMVGSTVTVSGAAAGCVNPNPSYEFWILYPGSGTWRLAQAYTTSPGYSWSTTGLAPGTYRFSVWARDSSSSASYDAWNAGQYFTLTSGCSSIAVSATPGNPVTIGGRASGCLNPTPLYEFWILYPGSGTWTLAQGYSTSAAYSWPTTGLPRGTYRFSVWVKDSSSSAPYDAWNAGQYWTL
jgi:hypothetical protein